MNRIALVRWLWPWLLCSVASAASWDLRDQLAGPTWSWSEPQVFDLPGARLRVQQFSARLEGRQAAEHLTRLSAQRFTRLQVAGSDLWLSGVSGAVHWLAQMRPRAGNTEGEVSSLEPQTSVAIKFDARQFVPPGTRRIILMSDRRAAGTSFSRLESEGRTDEILDHVDRRLRAERWQPTDASARPSAKLAGEWRHPLGAQLSVLHETRVGRVVLTFWYRAEAS